MEPLQTLELDQPPMPHPKHSQHQSRSTRQYSTQYDRTRDHRLSSPLPEPSTPPAKRARYFAPRNPEKEKDSVPPSRRESTLDVVGFISGTIAGIEKVVSVRSVHIP